MPTKLSNNAGNSSAEEKFVQLFCDVFGAEKGQYVYLQYPFVDIYGKHRTIDFAIKTEADKMYSSLSLPVTFQHKAKRSANISKRAK